MIPKKMEAIYFFFEGVDIKIEKQKKLTRWIERSILSYDRAVGNINYIFCSDEYLYKINKEYLKHDTYTDIITFDQSENSDNIEGDIYISIERVKDNANSLNIEFDEELHRVMAHGILHLLGFKDKTQKEKDTMRTVEEKMLQTRDL